MAIFRALQAMALWITLWKLWMNARSHNPGRMGEACGYALHRSLTRCAMPLICLVSRGAKNAYGPARQRIAHNHSYFFQIEKARVDGPVEFENRISALHRPAGIQWPVWEVGIWADGSRAAKGKES